jgi:hypothetical protein
MNYIRILLIKYKKLSFLTKKLFVVSPISKIKTNPPLRDLNLILKLLWLILKVDKSKRNGKVLLLTLTTVKFTLHKKEIV